MTARDLAELQEFLKAQAAELQRLGGQQEELAEFTPAAPELLLPDLEKRQEILEGQEDRALADARQLLDAEKLRRMGRRDPDFPAAPSTPEGEEEMVPPKEADTDEPIAEGRGGRAEDAEGPDEAEPDEEPLFQPALGGPQPKLDPRFAEKVRPVPPRKEDAPGKDDARARREELVARQQQKLREMELARQSLASDGRTLDALLDQLRQAMAAEDPEAAQGLLDRLMQDPTMQRALAMAARRQQMLARRRPRPRRASRSPPGRRSHGDRAADRRPRPRAGGRAGRPRPRDPDRDPEDAAEAPRGTAPGPPRGGAGGVPRLHPRLLPPPDEGQERAVMGMTSNDE